MKVARKLTLAILAVMVAVLSLNAVERVVRDRQAVRDDVRRDHRSLGRALQVVVRESFREDGEQRALSLVEAANQRENAVRIRSLRLRPDAQPGALTAEQRRKLASGQDVELVSERLGVPWLYSYAPVRLDDGRTGAIELGEALGSEKDLPQRIRSYKRSHIIVAGENPSELVPLEEVERRYILRVLEASAGNKRLAARVLGLDRKTLYRRLERYGVS